MDENQFLVIVHADRLGEAAKRYEEGTELYLKEFLPARILEQRIKQESMHFLSQGKPVYFLGAEPGYLSEIEGIQYIPDTSSQFQMAAQRISNEGHISGKASGVFVLACIDGLAGECKKYDVALNIDDRLTDRISQELAGKSLTELRSMLTQ
ncbi:MAG: hypothetical protein HGA85_06185 [Nanoarchaeota archaeon]|nr:hypothetical protein [Nanoarchaeota archaeon]